MSNYISDKMASVARFTRLNILPSARFMTGQVTCVCSQRHNSCRASISKAKLEHYVRKYDSILVHTDGSSVRIKYETPRMLLKLPVNNAELSPEEKTVRIKHFNPPKKIEVQEDLLDDYDVSSYSKLIKKRK